MMIEIDWTTLKSHIAIKKLAVQYEEKTNKYNLFAQEFATTYLCTILKVNPVVDPSDQKDFEDNYKALANAPISPIDDDGKPFSRAESRPLDMTTYFTSYGDGTLVGNGEQLIFDFSNTDNDVATPPTGMKQKELRFSFLDIVRVKEGTIYWENMLFGSTMKLCIAVPDQAYYKKNDGTVAQNTTGDILVVDTFVNGSPMMGNAPMGDELNTEAASAEVPIGTVFCLICTVPDTVTSSCHAAVQIELYRARTVTLL